MEVMLWGALSRSARKRCASINTENSWLAPDTREGRNDEDDIITIFAKEKAPCRGSKKHGAFLVLDSVL
jgi:hypothetical protein